MPTGRATGRGSPRLLSIHMDLHIIANEMQILIEIDERLAERLDRVAPSRSRKRSEFVRAAIQRALWDAEEKATEEAYARHPDSAADAYLDEAAWEIPSRRRRARRRK